MSWEVSVPIIVALIGTIVMAYPILSAIFRPKDVRPPYVGDSPVVGVRKYESDKIPERVVKIEAGIETLKETARAVSGALAEHDKKDDMMFMEIRREFSAGIGSVHAKIDDKIDSLTKTVISLAQGNAKK